jgi:hypothetical protein
MSEGDDEAEEIEQSLLADFPPDEVGCGECRLIVESWLARIRQRGGANRYKRQLWDGCNVLKAIRDACWSNYNYWLQAEKPSRVPQTLWAWPHDSALLECPKEWLEKSPASLDELDSAMAEYLNRPWLRHDTIDVSVINALIFTELALYADEVRSGRPTEPIMLREARI